MTPEQVGLYQAVLDNLLASQTSSADEDSTARKGHVLAAITHLKQICDHPAAYLDDDDGPLDGRSGKLARLEELIEAVFEAGERMLVFTHFARWGERLAKHLTKKTGLPINCYHGGLTRMQRDRMVKEFQEGTGPGALVVSIKAGGTGLNLTAASHVVLYDRWWNPAVEDQARDRAWRIGQAHTVICHRLVCPGTVDERVEEVVAGKRRIADLVLPASSSLGDLSAEELRTALGLRSDAIVEEVDRGGAGRRGGRMTPNRRRRQQPQAPLGQEPPGWRPVEPGRQAGRRPRARRRSGGTDFWGKATEGPPSERKVRPTIDPGAVVRSLGDPPLGPNPATAAHHLTAIYEEAVRAATALAAANGLLEDEVRRPTVPRV